MRRLASLAAALALLAACSSERSLSGDTTGVTSVDTTVSAVETTIDPATTEPAAGPATTAVPTTAVPTTAASECVPVGDSAPKTSDDPLLMTGAVGVDIRTGTHPCFERLVIEAGNGDFPGWTAEYVDGPVRLGESDEFVDIAGDATLSVRISMWMPTMEGDGYNGKIDVFPNDVVHILELRETENFEGMCIWSIGLDAEYPFTAIVLHSPERLVIDVHVPDES